MMSVKHFQGNNMFHRNLGRGGLGYHKHSITGGSTGTQGPLTRAMNAQLGIDDDIVEDVEDDDSEYGDMFIGNPLSYVHNEHLDASDSAFMEFMESKPPTTNEHQISIYFEDWYLNHNGAAFYDAKEYPQPQYTYEGQYEPSDAEWKRMQEEFNKKYKSAGPSSKHNVKNTYGKLEESINDILGNESDEEEIHHIKHPHNMFANDIHMKQIFKSKIKKFKKLLSKKRKMKGGTIHGRGGDDMQLVVSSSAPTKKEREDIANLYMQHLLEKDENNKLANDYYQTPEESSVKSYYIDAINKKLSTKSKKSLQKNVIKKSAHKQQQLSTHLTGLESQYKDMIEKNRQSKIDALTAKNQAKSLAKQNLANKMVGSAKALAQQQAQQQAQQVLVDIHNNYKPTLTVAKPTIQPVSSVASIVKKYFDNILAPLNASRGQYDKYGYGNAFEFCAEYQLSGIGNPQVDAAMHQLNLLGIIEWFSKDNSPLINNANNPRIPTRLQKYSVIDLSKQYTDIEFKYWNTRTYTFNYSRLEEISTKWGSNTTTRTTVPGVPLQQTKIKGNVSFMPLFVERNGKWKLYNVLNTDTGEWVNEHFYKTYFALLCLEEGLYSYNITYDIETNNTNVLTDDEFQPSKFEHKKIIKNIEKINTTSTDAFHHINITTSASGNKILETPAGERLNFVKFTYSQGTDSHGNDVYYIDKTKFKFIG